MELSLTCGPFADPRSHTMCALCLCAHHLLPRAKLLQGGHSLIFALLRAAYSRFGTLVFSNHSFPSFARATRLVWKWGCQSQQFISHMCPSANPLMILVLGVFIVKSIIPRYLYVTIIVCCQSVCLFSFGPLKCSVFPRHLEVLTWLA